MKFKKLLALFMSLSMACTLAVPVSAKETANTTDTDTTVTTPSRVSVHDPSIIKADDNYYVFGSHMADAKSSDLMDWTQMNNDYSNRETSDAWQNDSVYGDVLNNLAESFEWAGYDDGDCSGGNLAVWAPDVIYNPYYIWDDGSAGAYMLYYSASSTWRRSCIGYAVSKDVEGPYDYVDTVIYSGFSDNPGTTDGNSTRDTYWDNDYLNINELIDKGVIEGVSDNWFTSTGSWNSSYAPNAIDPTLFFDKEGSKLYMVYGSWSGGLFVLNIDPETGAVNYPGEDGTEETSGNVVDRYFGTRIAGGNGQSGEGSYILYDEETDYYYMYESYGGLTAMGGYNIRMFRSKDVYGPYLDAAGGNAKNSSSSNTKYGIKLMGNYQFTNQPGYRSAGHNSALIDDDGAHYLVYHQRFDANSTHEVRVRQQFMNEDGWPVCAVYEYRGESISRYDDADVTGSYEIINHGTDTSSSMISTQKIELCEDGTITGDLSGTWSKSTDTDKAYDYITLTIDGTTYKGFFYEQYNEKDTPEQVMTFSAIGDDNTCLWGTHRTAADLAADVTEAATEDTSTTDNTNSSSVSQNSNNSSKQDNVNTVTTDTQLKAPSLRVKIKKKKAVLSWKKISGAKGYQIWYSKNKKFKKAKKINIKKKSKTKKVIKGLKKGKTYYFRIRAYKKSNGKKVYGSFSKAKKKKV